MPSPSSPGSKPSTPSVALPSPTSSPSRSGGEQSTQSGKESSEQAGREKAGGDLQRAGERVATAGQQVGQQSGGEQSGGEQSGAEQSGAEQSGGEQTGGPQSGNQQASAEGAGQDQPDPLLPESNESSPSDDLIFDDSTAQAAQGGETDPLLTAEGGEPGGPAGDDPMSAEVEAAQQAMIEAGIRLQEAGQAVATAESGEDLARAQELLREARVILIVAGQDLIEARDAAGDGNEAVFEEAEDALNDATVAVVVATQAVEGMPDFEDLQTAGVPANRDVGELEDELEDTLGDFDKKILTARRTVLQPGRPQQTELPPGAGIPGSRESSEVPEASGDPELAESQPESGADSVGKSTGARDEQQVAAVVPEDIGPGHNDDIVAQQLREAAMAETDPELREKLWEEYRRYKSGL